MAARGARAAAGDAGDRFPQRRIACGMDRPCAHFAKVLRRLATSKARTWRSIYRWAEDQIDRLPELAAESGSPAGRRDRRDLEAATFAAKAATTTIPIVFVAGEDPVRLGLVASLARPGGNLTGVNIFATELAAKRLGLLRELVPGAARVAVFVNPTNAATAETTLSDLQAAARAIGLQIQVLNAGTSREIDAAFATFVRERPDALFVGAEPLLHQPARPNDPAGGAPRSACDICEGVNFPKSAG